MTLNMPNAFLQTILPKDETTEERVIMKLRGILVDMLEEISPEACSKFVTYQNNKKTLQRSMSKLLHGIIKASLLWYKQFVSDIKEIGCVINPYDACVANKISNNKQHALTWHADDVKSAHVSP